MIYAFSKNNNSLVFVSDTMPATDESLIYIESDTFVDIATHDISIDNGELSVKEKSVAPVSLDQIRQSRLEELNQVARLKYTQGFKSNAHRGTVMYYDSDIDKQREISQVAGIAEDLFAQFFPKGFPIRARLTKDADKQVLHLTLSEMHKLCADMLAWCETVKFYVWLYQLKIKKCETQEELEAIVFDLPNEIINKVTTMYDTGGDK